MKKIKIFSTLFLSLIVTLSFSAGFSAFAQTEKETAQNSIERVTETETEESELLSEAYVNEPSYSGSRPYYMVGKHEWAVGSGGNELALSHNSQSFSRMGTPTYTEYAWALVGSSYTSPWAIYGKSYDSSTNSYSTYYAIESKYGYGVYGETLLGKSVAEFAYWIYESDAKVPTSFDQTHYRWAHGSSNGNTILATIYNDGVYADVSVKIPLLGYKSSNVVCNGVTFTLRTGPSYCSIKAGSSNVYASYLMFQFCISGKY